jgi:hypothetical protein
MALKVYTTFLNEWHAGEADPISVHVTEQGAKRRLIDYISATLWSMSTLSGYGAIGDWLNSTLNDYGCAYDAFNREVANLSKENIDDLYAALYEYNEFWADDKYGCFYSYHPFILEA